MAASINDKFTEATNGSRPVPTTLTALLPSGASPGTATCGALTGWPTATAVHFIIYTVDVNGNKVSGSQTDWKGIVSGSTITGLVLKAGTNNGYSIGAVVEAAPTAAWADDLTEGLAVEHNQDGTHNNTVVAMLADNQTFTGNKTFSGVTTAEKIKFNAPQGFLINGQISRTVSSNNITVAIKGLDGNDPSASNPVYCRIGNTIRSITAALSVTKNAGTNWMSLGSTEHATQDIDVFVYLGYNATDGVVIGFSRVPYAQTYGDFSATTTNEKYAAISTITTAASTDTYELVGRVNVTLSASASYNWSVPATSVVINRPIFTTRWLSYTPTLTNFTGTINVAKYQLSVQKCDMYLKITQGASVTGNHTFTLPLSAHSDYAIFAPIHSTLNGYIQDLGTAQYPAQTQMTAANTLTLLCTSAAGTYTSPTATSATVPMTWVNGQDSFILEGSYPL